MLKRISYALVLVVLFSISAKAQKNFAKSAETAFKNREYFSAISFYKEAYSKERDNAKKTKYLFQIGECYRLTGDCKQQDVWYTKAINAKYPDPVAVLYLADAKKCMEQYDNAKVEYDKYKKLKPDDVRGENGSKSCELAAKWKQNPTRYEVSNMAQINSKEQDFCAAFPDGKKVSTIYFTSTRPGTNGGTVDIGLGQLYSDIFETKMDKNGKYSTPVPLAGPVNGAGNDGAVVCNKKGNIMYFTQCLAEKKKEIKCKIAKSEKKGKEWGAPELLEINVDSFNTGHPTLSADEQTLLFASDRPGGQGGQDIWMSQWDKKTKKWGDPVNLGPGINTPGTEVYPFLHEDGTLYFSSNGHIGMGGIDIFKADKKGENQWANVQNLKYPLNSAADDFAIVFEGKKERGYLSSNREGTKGSDDIWSFALPPCVFLLDGIVSDCKWNIPLENVTVKLIGSDGSSVEAKTDKQGYYKFSLTEGVTYEIKADPTGVKTDKADLYLPNLKGMSAGKVTTVGETDCKKVFKKDMCLDPKEKEMRFPDVLYLLSKWELDHPSNPKDSLDYLYNLLIDVPTLVIELSSHTDSRDNDARNLILSQKRAKSCVDYLISKGIPADRMVAKGYGESRLLIKDDEINKAQTKEEKEALHQKNRRTVFSVLRNDYVYPPGMEPKKPSAAPAPKKEETTTDDEDEDAGDKPAEQAKPQTATPAPGTATPATKPATTGTPATTAPLTKPATTTPAAKPATAPATKPATPATTAPKK